MAGSMLSLQVIIYFDDMIPKEERAKKGGRERE